MLSKIRNGDELSFCELNAQLELIEGIIEEIEIIEKIQKRLIENELIHLVSPEESIRNILNYLFFIKNNLIVAINTTLKKITNDENKEG